MPADLQALIATRDRLARRANRLAACLVASTEHDSHRFLHTRHACALHAYLDACHAVRAVKLDEARKQQRAAFPISHFNLYVRGVFEREVSLREHDILVLTLTNIDGPDWPLDPYAYRDADGTELCFAAAAQLPPISGPTEPMSAAELAAFFLPETSARLDALDAASAEQPTDAA